MNSTITIWNCLGRTDQMISWAFQTVSTPLKKSTMFQEFWIKVWHGFSSPVAIFPEDTKLSSGKVPRLFKCVSLGFWLLAVHMVSLWFHQEGMGMLVIGVWAPIVLFGELQNVWRVRADEEDAELSVDTSHGLDITISPCFHRAFCSGQGGEGSCS